MGVRTEALAWAFLALLVAGLVAVTAWLIWRPGWEEFAREHHCRVTAIRQREEYVPPVYVKVGDGMLVPAGGGYVTVTVDTWTCDDGGVYERQR